MQVNTRCKDIFGRLQHSF